MPVKNSPTPTWFYKDSVPAMEKRIQSIKEQANKLFNNKKLETTLANLQARWRDEGQYEDFKDYEKVLKPIVEKLGATFVKGVKRPFGFECIIDEMHYTLSLSASGYYSWTRHGFEVEKPKRLAA